MSIHVQGGDRAGCYACCLSVQLIRATLIVGVTRGKKRFSGVVLVLLFGTSGVAAAFDP